MSYLTLQEAADFASRVRGFTVEPATLLRAGVHGGLLIAAAFNSPMRNLTTHTDDDYVGLLILSPRELLTIETEGQACITGASSLDGKAMYSPQVIRTLAQLRVLVPHLDKFLPLLVSLDTQPQATLVTEADPTPWHLLATPAKLIAAFGPLTGMNKSWFNNAKDTPRLLAARHTAGKGGRKGREPMYCVFPVVQWLIDAKRRKGRPMEDATGWRVLKNQFPKVYEEYQTFEPDPD